MKLSELRPCVSCDLPPIGPGKGPFYVVRVSLAMVDPKAASGVLGVMQIVGGGAPSPAALLIAEAMAPDTENFVRVLGDEEPKLQTELILCQDCFMMKSDLALWTEKVNNRKEVKP